MRVLVIGRGGREHAILQKLSQSQLKPVLFVAPGNAGMREIAQRVAIPETEINLLAEFAEREKIDLTIVGPESSLCEGIVNLFTEKKLLIFGPTKEAAQIEGSKVFAKEMMQRAGIPTAQYKAFTDYEIAFQYIKEHSVPLVVKEDGLCSGKGVTVCFKEEEAFEAINFLKQANQKIIIEEFLEGPEFSLMALVNGTEFYFLPAAMDHKREYDGDLGQNTGGMGTFCPVEFIDNTILEKCKKTIFEPILNEMVQNGTPFSGVLFAGLMLTKTGVKVIEFNARFGDPETEVVLNKIENDLLDLILKLLNQQKIEIIQNDFYYHGVVLVSQNYPRNYEIGFPISSIKGEYVYHMGTELKGQEYVTNGGRVLWIGSKGKSLKEAFEKSYESIEQTDCRYLIYRRDIGKKYLEE